ncbi:MAG: hypothetical protein ACO29T_02090 [Steroidobacteraceae bacterium]
MRIERVVAGSFSEASELSRQLYGAEALLISSSRVGNSHELLVCTDVSDEDSPDATGDPVKQQRFAAALDAEVNRKPRRTKSVKADVRETSVPREWQREPSAEVAAVSGVDLVNAIRQELQAIETRLAHGSRSAIVSAKMALLEHGVSAAYAEHLLAEGSDCGRVSQRLYAEVRVNSDDLELLAQPLMVIGPAAAGTTTVSMQLAHRLAARSHGRPVVAALRDIRCGAREKFFAIADAAGVLPCWGAVPAEVTVVDAGGRRAEEVETLREEFPAYRVAICLPSYLSGAAAARWLDACPPSSGVIVSHWSPMELPLALLSKLAERKVPLIGVSQDADPTRVMDASALRGLEASIRQGITLLLTADSTRDA